MTRNVKNVWNDIKRYLSDSCNHEMCWIDKSIDSIDIKNKIKNELFVPQMPISWNKNPTEWLSSIEISDVLKQYEDKHDDFLFIGPSPIDYDAIDTNNLNYHKLCVWPELCHFNLKEHISNGINKIGFVFNTDKHYKSGSHWISMYLDLNKKLLFFFDSAGNSAPKQIEKLMKEIESQSLDNDIQIKKDTNYPKVHQRENTECGMYCLYFIISLLEKNITQSSLKKNG